MGGVAGRHRGAAGTGQRRRGRPASRTSHLRELIMSRYELTPRNDQPDVIKAVVGWDRPLQTYFAQVFTRTEAEPERSEEHTSELQSLMRISYAVFCLKKKKNMRERTKKTKTE